MRIHADTLTWNDVHEAAKVARAEVHHLAEHGSRKRKTAWEIALRGESSRWPNGGQDANGGKAATWDQWGVFLAALFDRDYSLTIPGVYDDAAQFHYKTACRFEDRSADVDYATEPVFWPADAHGDHSWDHSSVCRRCSARQMR